VAVPAGRAARARRGRQPARRAAAARCAPTRSTWAPPLPSGGAHLCPPWRVRSTRAQPGPFTRRF